MNLCTEISRRLSDCQSFNESVAWDDFLGVSFWLSWVKALQIKAATSNKNVTDQPVSWFSLQPSFTFIFCDVLSVGNMNKGGRTSSLPAGHGRPTLTFRPRPPEWPNRLQSHWLNLFLFSSANHEAVFISSCFQTHRCPWRPGTFPCSSGWCMTWTHTCQGDSYCYWLRLFIFQPTVEAVDLNSAYVDSKQSTVSARSH